MKFSSIGILHDIKLIKVKYNMMIFFGKNLMYSPDMRTLIFTCWLIFPLNAYSVENMIVATKNECVWYYTQFK